MVLPRVYKKNKTKTNSATETQFFANLTRDFNIGLLVFTVAMRRLSPAKAEQNQDVMCGALQLVGDAHLMIAHAQDKFDEYRGQYGRMSQHDQNVTESAGKDVPADLRESGSF